MSEHPAHQLKPTLGFWALWVYGVGDILGAGIYALVGQIAGIAGYASWMAFIVAVGAATLTGLSYAELAARYPHSGGASHFCRRGFRRDGPGLFVGWLVFCSGVVSMATLSHAFAGYASAIVPAVPHAAWTLAFLGAVCLVNFWGIQLSSTANVICTAVEAGGLVVVIVAGAWFLAGDAPPAAAANVKPPDAMPLAWLAVLQAGALAFYAYVGFEDLVNVADEARQPQRDLPRAILASLATAGVLYLAVIIVSVSIVPPQGLAASKAPLLDVVRRAAPRIPEGLFGLIPLFAVANSALLNSIMASRLLYGMSRDRLLPRWLGRVHEGRRTPHVAIGVVLAIAIAAALSGTLVFLAGTASVLLLIVFMVVHVALLIVKRRGPPQTSGFRIAWPFPALGAIVCIGLACFAPVESLWRAAPVVAIGVAIVAVHWYLFKDEPAAEGAG